MDESFYLFALAPSKKRLSDVTHVITKGDKGIGPLCEVC